MTLAICEWKRFVHYIVQSIWKCTVWRKCQLTGGCFIFVCMMMREMVIDICIHIISTHTRIHSYICVCVLVCVCIGVYVHTGMKANPLDLLSALPVSKVPDNFPFSFRVNLESCQRLLPWPLSLGPSPASPSFSNRASFSPAGRFTDDGSLIHQRV